MTDSYDAANQLAETSYSDSTPKVSFSYDADGRRTGMLDGTGPSSWSYDSLGRLTGYTNGSGQSVGYGYDLAGNETSITYPGTRTVVQGFNAGNQLHTITDWNQNKTQFFYDHNGNLTTEDLPNGVIDTYSFDQANRLTAISDVKGSATVFSAAYTYNPNSLISTDSSQSSGMQNYQYSALDQLCYQGSANSTACATPPTGAAAYAYDAAGNLTTNNGATQSYNTVDELCWTVSATSTNGCGTAPANATTYSYDANGNRTAATPASGGATSYSYNGPDELTAYQLGSNPATTYTYDGQGLRQSATNTTDGATRFLWDQSASVPLLLQSITGRNTTDYIYGPQGLPLEEILPSGATYYYAHDALGSTRALTDSTGAVQNTYSYGAYGKTTASTGTIANPLLYAGQYTDPETGLIYLRARYYDPATAQFLTVDPLVQITQQPYSYANGDPINGADPSGAAVTALVPPGACAPEGPEAIAGCDAVDLVGDGAQLGADLFESAVNLFAASSSDSNAGDQTASQSESSGCNAAGASGAPRPAPNFIEPTNPPQQPPTGLPPGYSVRVMGPTEQYPDGYWVETNATGQPVDPSTGKPPSNVTRAQGRAMTHVPLPPG